MASAVRIDELGVYDAPMGAPSAVAASSLPSSPSVVLVAVPDLPRRTRGLSALPALGLALGLTAGLMVGIGSMVGSWA